MSGAADLNVRKTNAQRADDAARVLNPGQRAEDVINQGKGRSATDPYVDVYRALGDPTRMRIMSMIARNDGEYPCTRLEAVLDITKSTISYHVKILSSTGLVKVRKDGRYYHYLVQRSVLDYFAPGLWERLQTFDD